tara:strand:- start:1668 stop:2447 length:780 start_codon:yes stop_codon:yes gene_type:complete
MKDKVSILISSCDKFKDVWPIFDFFFQKNWENCTLDKYFLSNYEINVPEGFRSISVGEDISWSNNLQLALNEIETPYVFILLDDCFINNKIDNEHLQEIFSDFLDNDGNYLKFIAQPKSPYKTRSPFFNELPKGALYRSTAVFAIWKVDVLQKLLKSDENAWEFEEAGSIRSDAFSNFFVVNKNFFKDPIHGIVKGSFLFTTYTLFKKKYPELIPLVKRKINTRRGEYLQFFTYFRHAIFYVIVPFIHRRKIKDFFTNK